MSEAELLKQVPNDFPYPLRPVPCSFVIELDGSSVSISPISKAAKQFIEVNRTKLEEELNRLFLFRPTDLVLQDTMRQLIECRFQEWIDQHSDMGRYNERG